MHKVLSNINITIMKIHKQSNSPIKPLAIVGLVIILVALGWLAYAHHYQKWPFPPQGANSKLTNTVDYNQPTKDQTVSGTTIKERVAEQAKNESASTNPNTSPSAANASSSSPATMDITATNKTSNALVIRTLIQTV